MFQYFPENYMWSLAVLRCSAGGGLLGEIDWIARDLKEASRQQPNGDLEAWYRAWKKLSEQLEKEGDDSLAKKRIISARDAYLRASQYWQWAEAFLPPDDPRAKPAYTHHLDCFAKSATLMNPKVEIIDLPFEGSVIKAYFMPPQGPNGVIKTPSPAVFLSDGLDGTKEEMFYVAKALSARGIGCFAADGPGQGATLRLSGLTARYDSEIAAGVIYDAMAKRPDVDPKRIGIMAASMGGYYAPRAVAFDKRYKACVAWGAIFDYRACWVRRVNYEPGKPISLTTTAALGTTGIHFLKIMGVDSWDAAFKKMEKFNLKDVAYKIECDILLVHGANDRQTPVAEAEQLFQMIGSKNKELIVYSDQEGGSAHVQLDRPEPALSRICDWFVDHL